MGFVYTHASHVPDKSRPTCSALRFSQVGLILPGLRPWTLKTRRKVMPYTQIGEDPLDAVINVRLTANEKNQIRESAGIAGLSMSEFIRRRALGRAVVAHADTIVIQELRRLGGLVKLIHTESHGAYSAETARILKELKKYIERLSYGR
jgi:uncharacterized protein (DUF1778 family)